MVELTAATDRTPGHQGYARQPLQVYCQPLAKHLRDNLKQEIKHFVKVMPLEYKRILEEQKIVRKLQLEETAMVMLKVS
jgi:glutamate synthase domain-containing protein 3